MKYSASKNDLETGGMGRSRLLQMAPYDKHIRSIGRPLEFVSIAVCTIFKLFDVA